MGLALKQPHHYLTTLNVVRKVYQIEVNVHLVHELRHTRAIHLSMKSRRQRWFHGSGELGLRLLTKSLIYGFLCIQISLQLCNLVLHVLKQLHQLLYISRGLGSHVDIFTASKRGVLQCSVEIQYTQNTKMHTESQHHSRNQM